LRGQLLLTTPEQHKDITRNFDSVHFSFKKRRSRKSAAPPPAS
jgi:hypothetical protein